MDLLSLNYGSDEEGDAAAVTPGTGATAHRVDAAPAVLAPRRDFSALVQLSSKQINVNLTADQMLAPAAGPAHPFRFHNPGETTGKIAGLGVIAPTAMDEYAFQEQFHNFKSYGYAMDRDGNSVGNLGQEDARAQSKKRLHERKRKTAASNGPKDLGDDGEGPWAPVREEEEELPEGVGPAPGETVEPVAAAPQKRARDAGETKGPAEEEGEEEQYRHINERKLAHVLPPQISRNQAAEARSTFHGTEEVDYQGRSWMHPPSGLRIEEHDCYIPKKCIHRYTGHTKGVQAIEFIPGFGHLILSGGLDSKLKIWDVYNDRRVRRTYMGHTEAIRSMCFNHDGRQFLSSAFDRYIRLWDTETGQSPSVFTNKAMAYCVKFYPNDPHIFLAACSDNKIVQYDTRTGEIVQEYNYHLQPVNTITFIDEGRRFVSTSDDKKVLVWEYDIPVPIKYISEPHMHAVPAVTLHPSGEYFVGQSLDNTIVTYSAGEKIRQFRKKTFRGHIVAGYACQIGFSPNGKYIMSGDGHGKLHFWDWKSTKSFRKLNAHDNGPCMGAIWHPIEPSWVATCGWDGLIKLWD